MNYTKCLNAPRFYDRERMSYAQDRTTLDAYAAFLDRIAWNWFGTLTFARRTGSAGAQSVFREFLNRLERSTRCDVGYVCGMERQYAVGSRSDAGIHFHVLLTSIAPIDPKYGLEIWEDLAGRQQGASGARFEPFHSRAATYALKQICQPQAEWFLGKLHLFHPDGESPVINKRLRRHFRRHPMLPAARRHEDAAGKCFRTPVPSAPTRKEGVHNER